MAVKGTKDPQIVIGVPKTVRDKGSAPNGVSKSDTQTMQSIYGNSPIHAERITDESVKAMLQEELNKFTYTDAPSYEDVPTGGGGLPASPFTPNPSSSPSGKPEDQPAAPDGYGSEPTSEGYGIGPSHNGTSRNPGTSSTRVARTIGELVKGVGSAG